MKIRFFILTVILTVLSSGILCAAEAESFTVNGLSVVFKQNAASDIVAAGIYFRGGPALLTRQQSGIEGFALTVATKATTHFPKDQLNSALESMNTQINSGASLDYASLNLLCVKQHFAKSWEIFADMLLSPLFDPKDVEIERQRLLSRLKQSRDNPDQYLNQLATHAFYGGHPYEVDAEGSESTVAAFSAADLKNHLKNRLVTSNMLLRDNLFEEVRTKRGLSYAPSGGTGGLFSNFGFVYVTAVNPDTTVKVIVAELHRLIDKPISQKKLRDKLNVFVTNYFLRSESNQSQAASLAQYELSGAGYEEAAKFVDNVKKVTPEEIQKVCKKYIENLQFVLIGNPRSLEVRNFMF